MGDVIGLTIVLMFMAVCIVGVVLIIRDKEFKDK